MCEGFEVEVYLFSKPPPQRFCRCLAPGCEMVMDLLLALNYVLHWFLFDFSFFHSRTSKELVLSFIDKTVYWKGY